LLPVERLWPSGNETVATALAGPPGAVLRAEVHATLDDAAKD